MSARPRFNAPAQPLGSVNAVLVRAVAQRGQATRAALLAHVTDVLGVETTQRLLGRRLLWLRDCGWLCNTTTAPRVGAWRLTPQAVGYLASHAHDWLPARLGPAVARQRAQAVQAAAAPVAPPPRRNVLHTPVWRPPVWQSARPGADDHKQYATRGVRC